jgi:hypothetical protein
VLGDYSRVISDVAPVLGPRRLASSQLPTSRHLARFAGRSADRAFYVISLRFRTGLMFPPPLTDLLQDRREGHAVR